MRREGGRSPPRSDLAGEGRLDALDERGEVGAHGVEARHVGATLERVENVLDIPDRGQILRLFTPQIEAVIPPGLLGDPDKPHHWGQYFGILAIELGVLMTVSATMITIFYGFAGRTIDAIAAEQRR